MFAKVFAKILDSSVWLESLETRIVWITLLVAMDEDGFAQFAAVENLARRANVPLAACLLAVERLEAHDPISTDPEHAGRRAERVPGGWLVLNAAKYRDCGSRAQAREKTRERVRRWREGSQDVVTLSPVQPELISTYASTSAEGVKGEANDLAASVYELYPKKVGRPEALRAILKAMRITPYDALVGKVALYKKAVEAWDKTDRRFIPNPATFFNQQRYNDDPSTWERTTKPNGNAQNQRANDRSTQFTTGWAERYRKTRGPQGPDVPGLATGT